MIVRACVKAHSHPPKVEAKAKLFFDDCGRDGGCGVRGRGRAWRGMRGRGRAWWGACMAGGMHGRGCAWQGACMAGGVRGRNYEIWSMNGRYAWYWNVFLSLIVLLVLWSFSFSLPFCSVWMRHRGLFTPIKSWSESEYDQIIYPEIVSLSS